MILPNVFINKMQELLGNDFKKYEMSLKKDAKRGFRINQNYVNIDDFKNFFDFSYKNIVGLDGLNELLTKEKVGNSIAHHLGLLYVQEPSSMLAVESLGVEEGDCVLDLCSAPGGKASQILEKNKTGNVVCNEVVRQRANILFSNIERQGFKNAVITSLTPNVLAESFETFFDKILVDAPCSGEGMFRKDPETISEWNEGLSVFNHERQMEILHEADKMLKTGGVLVYSTCTFNIDENERTVHEFAKKYDYEILELPKKVKNKVVNGIEFNGDKETVKCGRVFPHNDYGEGQFIAKLRKKSEKISIKNAQRQKNNDFSRQEIKLTQDFIADNINIDNYNLYKVGNNIYLYNGDVPLIKNGIVCYGVNIGTIEKGRVVPHHQLFKAYGKEFKNVVNLKKEDKRITEYLSGREIDVDNKNGLACVLVEGVPLGGGKVVNGRLKNYYPKGLRV